MIDGINHLTLAVSDAEESFRFYTEVLGFEPAAKWPDGAYLKAGDFWVALLADENARSEPLPEYTHFAFNVAPEVFDALAERIVASGAKVWQENPTEGASLYFLDPNGHRLEIHVTLGGLDLVPRVHADRVKGFRIQWISHDDTQDVLVKVEGKKPVLFHEGDFECSVQGLSLRVVGLLEVGKTVALGCLFRRGRFPGDAVPR